MRTIAPNIPKPAKFRRNRSPRDRSRPLRIDHSHPSWRSSRRTLPPTAPGAFLRRVAQEVHRCVAIRLATYGKRLRFTVIFPFRLLGNLWRLVAIYGPVPRRHGLAIKGIKIKGPVAPPPFSVLH